ncbi:hypothetical protein HU200_040610 [Digitaria exilis]|uniref:At1g61320/AtMIF1 LRR domain-containing protein n=1 Tax=Digitaria exilis TaxID=1010633 RepID=A0A835B7U6_9POAL|nr:hypothetical protein HU200_040610 [Digitaria exilis]
MPMEDSARAACVSRTFLRSWRHYPYLILSKKTLGLKPNACEIDLILKKHSGTGIKTLKLDVFECRDLNACYLNDWLQIAITPTIESLTLQFPSELLFGVNGNLIRYLHLNYCTFRPTVGTGCLISLTKLHLDHVRITGEELGRLLSISLALMQLELKYCNEITCLKIPCMLEQLSCLTVSACSMLQMIESQAPNLTTLHLDGDNLVQLSLGQFLQVKNLVMDCSDEINFLNYSVTKLPYMVPNLETLTLFSYDEMVNTSTVAAKFHHLKYLKIYLDGGPGYDFCSLGSFLDASPVLETFILSGMQTDMEFDPVFWDASNMRQMPEHKYESLKAVMIFGFCSDKSMVELTCHILENATSLESITLDTVNDNDDKDSLGRCSVAPARGKCCDLSDDMILEANKGLIAIKKYIAAKVPSTSELHVRGPCSQCRTLEPYV